MGENEKEKDMKKERVQRERKEREREIRPLISVFEAEGFTQNVYGCLVKEPIYVKLPWVAVCRNRDEIVSFTG